MSSIHDLRVQACNFFPSREGRASADVPIIPEAAKTPWPRTCAQTRPSPMPPSSSALRLQLVSGQYAFSMLVAAGTQEPFDPTLAVAGTQEPFDPNSARAYQEVRSTLCPLWALRQAARLLACEAQPFEPWSEGGCCQSPAP